MRFAPWIVALLLAGCGPRVKASSVRTAGTGAPHVGPVVIRASEVPPGAREIGIAEAHGTGTIEDLVPAFAEHVSKLGGNFGKIDDINTKYEMSAQSSTESYSCGTPSAPRTCTRSVTRQVEVATTTVVGRAFVVEKSAR